MSVTYPGTACDGTVKDVRITWKCFWKSQYGFLWTVTKWRIFVIIAEYNRYPVVEVVWSVAAKTVIPVLYKVISAYVIPLVINMTMEVYFNLLNSKNTWSTCE